MCEFELYYDIGLPEQSSRPVDQDHLGSFGLGLLTGPLDELAVDEGRSGADQGDEVGCGDGAPSGLGLTGLRFYSERIGPGGSTILVRR